ncbi:MAG: hypothetical protein CMI08_10795 [Oceanospirillaceae bacterium]|uniref:LPP20 family lipoprotein n=1 Tax=unclassified Thalassolituus TaxID=2624967 RepID=UPI000C67BD1C|nr:MULTISPECIES: LPP20 family lipoprotein [unclassified Thalassolituus]MAX99667.1 hypothetical protein [Oceanospirillaceae bacterium]MBL35416.1 hypothetical protein [Oceanospirillaceae bacterium]MBS51901.1 hypothetical protein [Oceanospirillaceae bacterium]
MNKFSAVLLLVAGACLTTGCATQQSKASVQDKAQQAMRPDWITQPPQQSGMAYGVGSMEIYGDQAAAVKRAAELARVDLVSQLKVTVTGDFSSSTTETSGTGRASEVQRSVTNYARSQVPEAELDEVVQSDSYVDGTYAYVLVELNRSQAAARLRRDVDSIDEQIMDIAAQSRGGEPLQQLTPLLPAVKLFAQRERLSERLALVSMNRQGAVMSAELRALQRDIYDRIGALRVSVVAQDSDSEAMRGPMIEALTDQGMKIQSGGSYDLEFQITADQTSKQQSGNYYAFLDCRVTIVDNQGRALSSFSQQAKGVSGLKKVALQKAVQSAGSMMAAELAATLVDDLH